eukprot:TRINITY_DN20828_c0_g1_i1.p1 TRINITY_DN20828_c0_g1~~TRINITY_DN20828_c0_g1_i1.p1  ORF type:complete len:216 (+),score=54.47 TRINITY_DN20828_c0_g1_i1:104-751(+)
MKLSIVCVFSILLLAFAKKNPADLTDEDIRKIEEEWEKDDDIEPEDLPPWKRPDKPSQGPPMPNIEPGKPVDPSVIAQMQTANLHGKPQMMFVTFEGDSRDKNEEISGRFTAALRQGHIEIKVYFLEDDKCIISIDDGKYAMEVINFLKEQPEVAQIELDSKKYMPAHPKDSKSKAESEEKEKERKEKQNRIKEAQKRLKKAQKKRRRRSKKDEL